MRKIGALLWALWALTAQAQINYCTDFQQFREDQWITLDSPVQVTHRSMKQKMWWGGSEFKFTTGDKKTDKLLRKKAFIILYEDSVYVNCKRIKCGGFGFGTGYTKALRFDKSNLLIVHPPVDGAATVAVTSALFGVGGGLVSATLMSQQSLENQACYLLNTLGKNQVVNVRHIDTELMETLLFDDPDLLKEYMSVKKKKMREGAANTLDIFIRKGWVKQ